MRLRHLYLIREFQFSRVHHVVGRPVPIAVQPALRSKASFGISCSRWRPFASPARTCGATSVSRRHEARFLSQASKAMEPWHRAFVALGSNIGDRFAVVEKACKSMESQGDIRILRTSGLWETDAMYFENQDRFLNGACEVGKDFTSSRTMLRPQNHRSRRHSVLSNSWIGYSPSSKG